MLKHIPGKTQLIIFLIIVAMGTVGYFGWNVYSEKYQVKAVSFDLSNIMDDAFYAAYKAYMSWVNGGVKGGSQKFTAAEKRLLQPFYENDLDDVRFYYTTRLDGLGMVDCNKIYFGDKTIVDKLKKTQSLTWSEMRWLAHELAHTEQCAKLGGRKKYAVRWFREVKKTILLSIQSGQFKNIVRDIFNAQKLAKYDDNMAMEQAADKRASEVIKKLKQ